MNTVFNSGSLMNYGEPKFPPKKLSESECLCRLRKRGTVSLAYQCVSKLHLGIISLGSEINIQKPTTVPLKSKKNFVFHKNV